MKVIPRESKRITYSSEIRNLKSLPLTKQQREIVIGSVLGDACLAPNWSSTNYCLKITRSAKQQEYIKWQYENLKPFVLTAPRLYERTRSYTIRTISHSELTELRKFFYPFGKKVIPKIIAEYLKSALVLAVWFMDDGNAVIRESKLRGYHLNTQSFTFDENEQLSSLLKKLHGIESSVESNKGYYRIGIWQKASRDKFRGLIEAYIVPSIRYKLG